MGYKMNFVCIFVYMVNAATKKSVARITKICMGTEVIWGCLVNHAGKAGGEIAEIRVPLFSN